MPLFRCGRLFRSFLQSPHNQLHNLRPRLLHVPLFSDPSVGRRIAAAVAIGATAVVTFAASSKSAASSPSESMRLLPPSLLRSARMQDEEIHPKPSTDQQLAGPRLALHKRVIYLIACGDLDTAVSVFRSSLRPTERRPPPDVLTCNAVLSSLLSAGRHDGVISLFRSFIQHLGGDVLPDVDIFITACRGAGRIDEALDACRQMVLQRPSDGYFSLSPDTYRFLVKGLLAADSLGDAIDLLKRMYEIGGPRDATLTIHDVITQLGSGEDDNEMGVKAVKLFDELHRRLLTPEPEKSLVHGMLSAVDGYWPLDRGFYQSMLNPTSFKALLRSLLLQRPPQHQQERQDNDCLVKVSLAEMLFERMLEYHNRRSLVTVDAETCNLMLNQKFKEGRTKEAVELFRRIERNMKLEKEDEACCLSNVIGKLCENGNILDAEKLLEELPELDLVPLDAATCEPLIDGCLREGREQDAVKYFNMMYINSGSVEADEVRICNKMIHGLMKAECSTQAMELFQMMSDCNVAPDELSLRMMALAAGELTWTELGDVINNYSK